MKIAGRAQIKTRETNVDAYDQRLAGVQTGELDDCVEMLCAAGCDRVSEDGPAGAVAFADQDRGLVAVQPDVSALAGLAGRREVHPADAHGKHVFVADAGLAIVLGIEVVNDDGRLARVGGAGVHLNLCEEDDTIAAIEVLRLKLLDDVRVDSAVVVAKVLALRGADLVSFAGAGVHVRGVLRADEVQPKVAAFSGGPATAEGEQGEGGHQAAQRQYGRRPSPDAPPAQWLRGLIRVAGRNHVASPDA